MKGFNLLKYHMNCNPDYMFAHAIIAGKLSLREFKTYSEYKQTCSNLGIAYYNEECFNNFMEDVAQESV